MIKDELRRALDTLRENNATTQRLWGDLYGGWEIYAEALNKRKTPDPELDAMWFRLMPADKFQSVLESLSMKEIASPELWKEYEATGNMSFKSWAADQGWN